MTTTWLPTMCLVVVLCGSLAGAQSRPDPFSPIAFLIGRWEGRVEGQPGSGTAKREYAQMFDGRYIRIDNTSTYPPQPKNPKGEIHHDVGFFSFDTIRKLLVLRQFHTEGFVNQFSQEPAGEAGRVVFTTEAIENIPAGFRARETYVALGTDAFEEVFEMAEPGKNFEVYSRTRFSRLRP